MKTSTIIILSALAWGFAQGQDVPLRPPGRVTGIGIVQTTAPVFPNELLARGVTEGWANIVIDIDEEGRLTDALLTGCSHPRFGQSALAALARWSYRPGTDGSRAIPTVSQLQIQFRSEADGVRVVNINGMDYAGPIGERPDPRLNKLHRVQELDRVPLPVKLVEPAYSKADALDNAGKKVTVTFYIDETGRVRMPALAYADDEAVARRVLAAVQEWRFEPPLFRNRPVITKASQTFVYKRPTG